MDRPPVLQSYTSSTRTRMKARTVFVLVVSSTAISCRSTSTTTTSPQPAVNHRAQLAISACPPVLVLSADSVTVKLKAELSQAKANVGATFSKKLTAAVTNSAALGTYHSAFGCRAGKLNSAARDVADELLVEVSKAWTEIYKVAGKGPAEVQQAQTKHMQEMIARIPTSAVSPPMAVKDVEEAFEQASLLQTKSMRTDAGVTLGEWAGKLLGNAGFKLEVGAEQFAIQSLEGNTLLAAQQTPSMWRSFLTEGGSKRSLFIAVVGGVYQIGLQLENAP
jgi:hypothetical protein